MNLKWIVSLTLIARFTTVPIKAFGKTSTEASSVDGYTGAEDILNNFADIYSELYQKYDLGEEYAQVQESIALQVDPSLLGDLDRVTRILCLKL